MIKESFFFCGITSILGKEPSIGGLMDGKQYVLVLTDTIYMNLTRSPSIFTT